MNMLKTLLVATTNKHKLRELRELLSDNGMRVIGLDDLDHTIPEIIEDGDTFKENACKKAEGIACASGYLSLADDSGLCVDALDGMPGVHSARYAGEEKDDKKNCAKLLFQMQSVDDTRRKAEFRCAMALATPEGLISVVEAACEGVISRDMRGQNGFGYDPIFIHPVSGKTFAELLPDEKNEISHRVKALMMIKEVLADYLGV